MDRYKKHIESGRTMTLCLGCESLTHTYLGKCTVCGKVKSYHLNLELCISIKEAQEIIKTVKK